MIHPKHLSSWQPDASESQLNDFIQQNQTLLILLEEAWQKFIAQSSSPAAVHEYAADVSPEELSHHPITQEEMMAFLNHFEREREHNDRPFGDDVKISEQNWEIIDNS